MRPGTSRSAFARKTLREALAREHERALEEKHRVGYARKPVLRTEFGVWEPEQVWPKPLRAVIVVVTKDGLPVRSKPSPRLRRPAKLKKGGRGITGPPER